MRKSQRKAASFKHRNNFKVIIRGGSCCYTRGDTNFAAAAAAAAAAAFKFDFAADNMRYFHLKSTWETTRSRLAPHPSPLALSRPTGWRGMSVVAQTRWVCLNIIFAELHGSRGIGGFRYLQMRAGWEVTVTRCLPKHHRYQAAKVEGNFPLKAFEFRQVEFCAFGLLFSQCWRPERV